VSKVIIGEVDGKDLKIDLDILLRTRLLVQANSGGGKSWAIRRLVEQAFGKIQIIIIDPEGEFATLREKFGFVLSGKGGDTPADVRSAELLAQKLLEINASCVCDIFEMKPFDRHRWVSVFLQSMLNASKKLWHPVLVVVDEAHKFCPEKGAGESEASEAMVALATTGRKRGFCAIFATQRLGKLRKDASAELQNRLVGPTFEDVDRKRAAELLGVLKSDEREFFRLIQTLEPGNFFALGRAISLDRVLVKIGPVQTTHPEVGAKYQTSPPPPPEKVQALLPQLADLPKEAEEKAKTVADLQHEVRSLKAQLRAQPKPTMQAAPDEKALTRAMLAATVPLLKQLTKFQRHAKTAMESLNAIVTAPQPQVELPSSPPPVAVASLVLRERESQPIVRAVVSADSNGTVTNPQKRILAALADFNAIGRTQVPKSWIAARAGVSHSSGSFANNLGALRSFGLIDYPGAGMVAITPDGLSHTPAVDSPLTTAEMLRSCMQILTNPQGAILRVLHEVHPEALSKKELAERVQVSADSGSFANNLGAIRSAGMLDYPSSGMARCSDWLFID
jgi:uncharacterized protein